MELTYQDIAAAVAIIDACVKRGAFEGSEIGEVGAIRNRLANFANAAAQQAAQQATEKFEEEAKEETTTEE